MQPEPSLLPERAPPRNHGRHRPDSDRAQPAAGRRFAAAALPPAWLVHGGRRQGLSFGQTRRRQVLGCLRGSREHGPRRNRRHQAALRKSRRPAHARLDGDGWLRRRHDGRTDRTAAPPRSCARRPSRAAHFLAVGFKKPHLPWAVPKEYFDLYPAGSVKVPKDEPLRTVPPIALMTELTPSPPPKSPQEALTAYYAAISFVDAQTGVLLKQLDDLHLWDSTIVVLIGDNGFTWATTTACGRSRTLFEQAARVPLIIAAPGHGRGKSLPHATCRIDRPVPNPGGTVRSGAAGGAGGNEPGAAVEAPRRTLPTGQPSRWSTTKTYAANRCGLSTMALDGMGRRQAGDRTLRL